MNDDSILIRHLHGELTAVERAALDRRLREEPELRRRLDELEATWQRLEPLPGAVDSTFREEVVERARRRTPTDSPLAFPAPRIAAALALVAGLGFGLDLGSRFHSTSGEARAEIEATLDEAWGAGSESVAGEWLPSDPLEGDDR